MKLIKQINQNAKQTKAIVQEDGATGAGAIAGNMMPLFSTLVQRSKPVAKPTKAYKPKKMGFGLKEAFDDAAGMGDGQSAAQRDQTKFDTTEVMAKLKGLEKKEKVDQRDTTTFGLTDENGGIVRVSVKAEQAQDFEKTLEAFLSGRDEEDEDATPEIAEILYKLKDQFDIVDVQWPDVVEDEEEDMGVEGGDPSTDPNAPAGEEGMEDMDLGAEGGEDTTQVQGLLTQVIDMMKADAEARKADAQARQAEAKVKEADAIVAQAMTRVKQEEQYLDMDQYNKNKKEQDKEAKRLAQLAKWKHDMGRENGTPADSADDFSMDEEPQAPAPRPAQGLEQEEIGGSRYSSPPQKPKPHAHPERVIKGRIHPHDVASFILSRVK